jgi:hypothetical protein
MNTASTRMNRVTVLAEYLGWDRADVPAYEYRAGRFATRVYSIGRRCYCVTTRGQTPPQDVRGDGPALDWRALPADTWPLPRYPGTVLWVAE